MILTGVGLLEIAAWHSTAGLLTGLALAGLGLGAFTPANNATIMGASPPGHAGVVSGVLNMTRGMGTALGVALASAIYTSAAGPSGTRSVPAAAHGFTAALVVLGFVALAAGLSLVLIRTSANVGAGSERRPRDRPMPHHARPHEPDHAGLPRPHDQASESTFTYPTPQTREVQS